MKLPKRLPAAAIVVTLILAAVMAWKLAPSVSRTPVTAVVDSPSVPSTPVTPVTPTSPAETFPEEVVLRPLPISLTSARHEWTDGDTSDPGVIQRIAHNPDEAIRMIEENERIHRRQLVYRKETTAAAVQQAMARGERISRLTLPGLDGQELVFQLERADLASSGQTGTFTGHLAGKPSSQVSLAYKFGREAFTVISPDDNLYLQADPREPGEIIVKAIDPATYIQGTCGNPGHNH